MCLRTSELQSEFTMITHRNPPERLARRAEIPPWIRPRASQPCRGTSRGAFIWPKAPPQHYARGVLRGAGQRIDPTLVLAIAAVESKFNPEPVNPATGARGLMQIMPRWHQDKILGIGGEPR